MTIMGRDLSGDCGPAANTPHQRVKPLHHWRYQCTPSATDSFGTHEFIGLFRAIGAEQYLSLIGTLGRALPRRDAQLDGVRNYPSGSALAVHDERAANGSPEPLQCEVFGALGNENWGCGGAMTGDEYATVYRRFANYLKPFGGTNPFLIA